MPNNTKRPVFQTFKNPRYKVILGPGVASISTDHDQPSLKLTSDLGHVGAFLGLIWDQKTQNDPKRQKWTKIRNKKKANKRK